MTDHDQTTRVTVALPTLLLRRFLAVAAGIGLPKSQAVRQALDLWLRDHASQVVETLKTPDAVDGGKGER